MRLEFDKVVLVPDCVHVRGVSVEDGVALLVVRQSPSIVDAGMSMRPLKTEPMEIDEAVMIVRAGCDCTYMRQTFSASQPTSYSQQGLNGTRNKKCSLLTSVVFCFLASDLGSGDVGGRADMIARG